MAPLESVLLAHVLLQTKQNVQFLQDHGYIAAGDASNILATLNGPSSPQPAQSPENPGTPRSSLSSQGTGRKVVAPPVRPPSIPPPPPPAVSQARALWDYNIDGQDVDDLSFAAGDIITIEEETNADWWTGIAHGKTALFPSAYVEKISATYENEKSSMAKPPYKPFGAVYLGAGPAQAPVAGPANGLQQPDPNQEQKKPRFGRYGNTMAQAAAGGVGFGAGAAIGGGIVNAIF